MPKEKKRTDVTAADAPPTSEQLEKFLAHFTVSGRFWEASFAAGLSGYAVRVRMEADEKFLLRVKEAQELYADSLESEAERRAVYGIEKDRIYSDRMLEMLLRKHRPELYRDTAKATVEINANTGVVIVERRAESVDEWMRMAQSEQVGGGEPAAVIGAAEAAKPAAIEGPGVPREGKVLEIDRPKRARKVKKKAPPQGRRAKKT